MVVPVVQVILVLVIAALAVIGAGSVIGVVRLWRFNRRLRDK